VEFRLLGPFEACQDGRIVDAAIRRQERCLLGALLLDAGRVVPIDRLIDLLWDGDPPASARGTVHTYVGRLRKAFGPYGVRIETRGVGYRVDATGHTVDVARFTRLVDAAAAAPRPAERARHLDAALGLWRGPLMSDVADDRLRARLGAALEEMRLAGVELRAEARLDMRLPNRVVTDLAPLAVEFPTRERLVGLLMTAQVRCGRVADALELYRQTRQVLVDELGLEPGPDLQSLHERILRGDPRLSGPAPVHVVTVRGRHLPWNVGGHVALDFCNTFGGWGHQPPLPGSEWLRDYATLSVWAGYMGLADDWTVTRLLKEARRRPGEAGEALETAKELRTRLYDCLADPADTSAFRAVAQFADSAATMSVFTRGPDALGRWRISPDAGLLLPVHAVARAAAELLADPRRLTVRRCSSPSCGWLFLDHTGLRRWCSLLTCEKADRCVDATV
jgi:DNA-binding SARP family transcriptional activator